MRRIRHLDQCDYIVPIKQGTDQLLTMSNRSNVLLKRSWHFEKELELDTHIKFNSNQMNGIQVVSKIARVRPAMLTVQSANLYRVSESSWAESFIYSIPMVETDPGIFSGTATQSDLGLNELSGMETYRIIVLATRGRKKITSSRWFNHLGSFDSIIRLRHAVESLEIMKVDE